MRHPSAIFTFMLVVPFGCFAARSAADEVGNIKARAVFKGDPDAYKNQKIKEVAATECQQFHPILTEDVEINRGNPNTLRNVIVWIKSGPIEFRDFPPSEPAAVMATRCKFSPHVIAMRQDQPLLLRNEDAIRHRFTLKRTKDKEFTVTIPKPGMQISTTLQAEDPMPLVSTEFPWMKAWVAVFDHPYFATTGTDGKISFSSFPPGEYEVAAWHEKFGTQTKKIAVKAGETTEVDFVFEPTASPHGSKDDSADK